MVVVMVERILSRALEALSSGKKVALCIVVKKEGSAPRDEGAKMLVTEDGEVEGTIGGGKFEELVKEEALEALKKGASKLVRYSFGFGEGVDTGLPCGGAAEVFIDVLTPKPRLVIMGVGHVGIALARLARELRFEAILVDEAAEEPGVLAKPPSEALREVKVGRSDYIVIAYGDPERDYEALRVALKQEPSYIGLLGSKRKTKLLLERLSSEGFNLEHLRGRLYAPVGIDLGADTPEEVALSIMAEIIGLRKGAKLPHLSLLKP
ncbi:MAG: XdhC family protein [Thermoprotei archaeon]|nr:MAG: XdhC family protein [Thermoprotei archaeon]